MHRVPEYRLKAWLQLPNRVGIKHPSGHAPLVCELKFPSQGRKCAVGVINRDATISTHIALGVSVPHQRLVLGNRLGQQRAHQPGMLDELFWFRGGPKRDQPRCNVRQEFQMVVCFRRAMKEDAYQVPKTVWECGRKHPGAPNHPSIPIRGFFAWSPPIDESDRNTPLGQLECHRGAHDPGTEDEDRKSTRLNSSHLVISYA